MDFSAITEQKIVPVVVIHDVEDALPLAEALLTGGLNVIEITFRTPTAETALERIARAHPRMIVGAGTLLEPQQLQRAKDAGARFGVAPGLSQSMLAEARRIDLPFIPGVMSPSEVEAGIAAGCRLLKFFPANLAGGPAMLKALAGPYAHTEVRFVALGGVTPANMGEYLSLPIVAAVGGSWLVEPALLAAKSWSLVTNRTREALAAIAQLK
jgi:2-dehydro-3-deoxyphosphogluconate aldolase/(4S)-4-hydroxy-2-oxoglutarate aldolase